MILKTLLDNYIQEYETEDFIKNDPIQFPHRFSDPNDVEIAGFLAAMFAYGKREVFIEKLNILFNIMDNKPYDFVMNFDKKGIELKNFGYRFAKDNDFIEIFSILNMLYSEKESLRNLFSYSYSQSKEIKGMLQGVVDYFYARVDCKKASAGFYHLLPNPHNGSAVKRLNMLLRWFVRDGKVDLGIWKFIDKSEILIPLDVHVSRLSRELGLLKRTQNDFKSVMELTNELKKLDPKDPVKYDFALFGYGVNNK